MRISCLSVASLLLAAPLGFAATTSVNTQWTDNFGAAPSQGPIVDSLGTPLTGGDPALPSDGAVFQIGYFAGVPLATNPADYTPTDWGSFTPITGLGSNNAHIDTTIGDGSTYPNPGFAPIGADGFYTIGVTFDTATETDLPGATSRLGIRFFETTNVPLPSDASNIVTSFDGTWEIVAPADIAPTPANASLDARAPNSPSDPSPGLVWQNGPTSAFSTIPEPSTTLLSLLGAALLLRRRR